MNFSLARVSKSTPEIPVRRSISHTDPTRIVKAEDTHHPTRDYQQSKEAQERELLWRSVIEKALGKHIRESLDKRHYCDDTDETDHGLSDAKNSHYARVEDVRAGVRHRAEETEGASCAKRGTARSKDRKETWRCL